MPAPRTCIHNRLVLLTVVMIAMGLGSGIPAMADNPGAVEYDLGPKPHIRELYPDASWLPEAYASDYEDLTATIEHFTTQSLKRDGVPDPEVSVGLVEEGETDERVRVRIQPENATTRRYATVHPAFLDSEHAAQARRGVEACKAREGCWDPHPQAGEPWTLFLPLGLPLASQRTVLFLDYPPIPALTGQDYLENYTMCRWGRIMGAAGAENPDAFQTIVDARPIAAPGTGQTGYLPDPVEWFDDRTGPGGDYLRPMLRLLATQPDESRPVAVFGADARRTWARMIGRDTVRVLDTGSTSLAPDAPATPWIATNHPDVTSYNCCPDNPSEKCGRGSRNLIEDEEKDFVSACWLITMAEDPGASPEGVRKQCEDRWSGKPSAEDRQSLCIQAKLDTNAPEAACDSFTEAWNYCSAHEANACASHDCRYDPDDIRDPVPPPARRPAGWDETCNHYRWGDRGFD